MKGDLLPTVIQPAGNHEETPPNGGAREERRALRLGRVVFSKHASQPDGDRLLLRRMGRSGAPSLSPPGDTDAATIHNSPNAHTCVGPGRLSLVVPSIRLARSVIRRSRSSKMVRFNALPARSRAGKNLTKYETVSTIVTINST